MSDKNKIISNIFLIEADLEALPIRLKMLRPKIRVLQWLTLRRGMTRI